jgi:D-serine deaminase-like pyridoxal phosphate-dependent protein
MVARRASRFRMLTTPPVIVDLPRLEANIHRFHRASAAGGCQVRAHLKAHRTIEIPHRQVAAGAVGVAVQTARAACRLAAAGITDVVLAWPWPEPWRFPLFAEAAAQVSRFAVHVDRPDAVTGIGAAAVDRGVEVGVRIDLRYAPGGAEPELAALAVATPGVRFDGITGYCATATSDEIHDRYEVGRRYARHAVEVAGTVRTAGIDCPVVSVGGTPAAPGALSVDGVTEICAGAYATFDGGLAEVGVCTPGEVALSVAAGSVDLLAGCTQPWDETVAWLPAAPPYQDRLVPAHTCPLAVTLVKRGIEVAVMDGDQQIETWQPFAAPDRQ